VKGRGRGGGAEVEIGITGGGRKVKGGGPWGGGGEGGWGESGGGRDEGGGRGRGQGGRERGGEEGEVGGPLAAGLGVVWRLRYSDKRLRVMSAVDKDLVVRGKGNLAGENRMLDGTD